MPDPRAWAAHFFVDKRRYAADRDELTGAEIKALADVHPTYALFRGEPGNPLVERVRDHDNVAVEGREFFSVPPAIFGG